MPLSFATHILISHKHRGGCSNQLFVCESSTSGSKVVIRWYGSDLTGEGNNHKPMSEEVEEQVMRRLSLTGLYPRLLLTFPGGRIEDFVSGRTPTITEINCPVVNLILMRKLATIHSMSHMPVDYSKPMFSFTTLHKYLRDMDNCVVQSKHSSIRQTHTLLMNFSRIS